MSYFFKDNSQILILNWKCNYFNRNTEIILPYLSNSFLIHFPYTDVNPRLYTIANKKSTNIFGDIFILIGSILIIIAVLYYSTIT